MAQENLIKENTPQKTQLADQKDAQVNSGADSAPPPPNAPRASAAKKQLADDKGADKKKSDKLAFSLGHLWIGVTLNRLGQWKKLGFSFSPEMTNDMADLYTRNIVFSSQMVNLVTSVGRPTGILGEIAHLWPDEGGLGLTLFCNNLDLLVQKFQQCQIDHSDIRDVTFKFANELNSPALPAQSFRVLCPYPADALGFPTIICEDKNLHDTVHPRHNIDQSWLYHPNHMERLLGVVGRSPQAGKVAEHFVYLLGASRNQLTKDGLSVMLEHGQFLHFIPCDPMQDFEILGCTIESKQLARSKEFFTQSELTFVEDSDRLHLSPVYTKGIVLSFVDKTRQKLSDLRQSALQTAGGKTTPAQKDTGASAKTASQDISPGNIPSTKTVSL